MSLEHTRDAAVRNDDKLCDWDFPLTTETVSQQRNIFQRIQILFDYTAAGRQNYGKQHTC